MAVSSYLRKCWEGWMLNEMRKFVNPVLLFFSVRRPARR